MLQRILLQNIPEFPLHFWIQDIEGLLWMYTTIYLIVFKKVVVWFSVPLQNRNKKSDSLYFQPALPPNKQETRTSELAAASGKRSCYTYTHHPLSPTTSSAPQVSVVT